ncbi:phage tail protein [Novispirillum itersonii]|uniref:phage tail protein n=1 Tax=Novispirillum itersonii TaxID=189 RepID=UPI00037B0112|nr:phage tail protein [Novispirillum itersonii]
MSVTCSSPDLIALQANVDVALQAAVTGHEANPFAHPEQKQVRQVITSTGAVYDPATGPQLRTAIDAIVGCAVSAHQADGSAHPELPQVRKVITDAGLTYNPADTGQLSQAISAIVEAVEPPDATETVKGVVRLANNAEAQAGALYTVAVHPAGLKATVDALINGAPASLNTLGELAAAIGYDANYAVTVAGQMALKAPLASPVLTGTPTAPTPAAGDNSGTLATTAFVKGSVDTAVSGLVNGAPTALNTLGELAAALGNDANYAVTVAGQMALKAPLASPELTGTPTAPTPVAGDNSTKIATTAFVKGSVDTAVSGLINGAPGALDTLNELAAALGNDANFAASVANMLAQKAPLASPALTGTPTAPTPAAGDNSSALATTAFVKGAVDGLGQTVMMPVGMECWYPGTTAPAGWLVENGALVSRADYPMLWAFVQASGMMVSDASWQSGTANRSKFSSGDGTTTFRLPDLITDGLFIRAQSPGDGNFGRRQEDDLKSHTHAYHTQIGSYGAGGGVQELFNNLGTVQTVMSTGGNETRPKNAGRLPIIKAH